MRKGLVQGRASAHSSWLSLAERPQVVVLGVRSSDGAWAFSSMKVWGLERVRGDDGSGMTGVVVVPESGLGQWLWDDWWGGGDVEFPECGPGAGIRRRVGEDGVMPRSAAGVQKPDGTTSRPWWHVQWGLGLHGAGTEALQRTEAQQ